MSANLITRITQLAGGGVADAIRAEFGGSQCYIPRAVVRFDPRASKRIRDLCLVHMDDARPRCLDDEELFALIQVFCPDVTRHWLRRELHYLAVAGLLTFTDTRPWRLDLTAAGIDRALRLTEGGAE